APDNNADRNPGTNLNTESDVVLTYSTADRFALVQQLMGVPADLQALPIFLGWRYEVRKVGEKPTKVPYRVALPTTKASSTDESTWGGFETALRAVRTTDLDGIGVGLLRRLGIIAVDLDGCRDPDTGDIDTWAQQIIDGLASYTEVSPSGTGIRIFIFGTMPVNGRRSGQIELYCEGRYVTVTGLHIVDTPRAIQHRQEQFDELFGEMFVPPRATAHPDGPTSAALELDDKEIVQRASEAANGDKFILLRNGNWNAAGYGSHSEADMAYCSLVGFWVGHDHDRIDRIFRASGLMRDKWDRVLGSSATYGSVTIEKALASLTDVYGSSPMHVGRTTSWPDPMDEVAFIGPLGELVRAIEPHSEADPVALLANALGAFGSVVGPLPHLPVEADKHRVALFEVLVGQSSKARKGTSWGHIREVFCAVDVAWRGRIMDGLSSGEGLIYQVRDETFKKEKNKSTGEYEEVIDDQGVEDKRLLIMEGEFANVLKVMKREANTLSAILRNAWDTGDLRVLTRNCPLKATGAHISVISHITKDELLRNLTATEMANGFANRFLWFCVRRSKKLPFGGSPDPVRLAAITGRIAEAVAFATQAGSIGWTSEARDDWVALYDDLSEGRPGMVGALTARGEAQVVRLAALYALSECGGEITPRHLSAAVAVWRYSEASVRFLYGDATGNDVADTLIEKLREAPDGLSRTQIRDLLSRHGKKAAVEPALRQLEGLGLARFEKHETGGKPAEVWFAT
ncbi:MAG: hypothetical protein L6413_03670, partial [Coriobacteriia bacterium]|nr:hypothetical protein [Coriobacteriia bacterium]